MTTFAVRSRPYIDPYPIASIKADALAARETRFANRTEIGRASCRERV